MLRSASIFIMMLLMVSCATQRTASVETSVHDTTYIERVTTYRDTVYYAQIPPESRESVTDDTLSVLTTSVAYSRAEWANGRLYHSLRNLDVLLPINVKMPETTVTTNHSTSLSRNEVVVREIPKMNWIQKVFFWIGILAVAFVVIRIAVKIFLHI